MSDKSDKITYNYYTAGELKVFTEKYIAAKIKEECLDGEKQIQKIMKMLYSAACNGITFIQVMNMNGWAYNKLIQLGYKVEKLPSHALYEYEISGW